MPRARSWSLAASTLGVVEEDLPTTVAVMRRHAVATAELRSADDAFVHRGSGPAALERVRHEFDDAGIDIFSIASGVRVAGTESDDDVVGSLLGELRTASQLGARYVRVFPGAPIGHATPDQLPQLQEPVELVNERAARRLVRVLDVAAELGVSPLIETHDSHPNGERLSRLLQSLDRIAPGHTVGAIWDVLHPWRVGEPIEDTAAYLLEHILAGRGYVQIKDAADRGDTFPVLQGRGVVPVDEFLDVLAEADYRGPVSLEWARYWQPAAAPLDEALTSAAAVLSGHSERSAQLWTRTGTERHGSDRA